MLDIHWIPVVAARDLVVIGRDKRIRTRPEEIRRLREAGLRVFRIGGKRDLATWDWLTRLVRHWDLMERFIVDLGPGSWFCSINENGVRKLDI